MTSHFEITPSIQQHLYRQGVQKISGYRPNSTLTTGYVNGNYTGLPLRKVKCRVSIINVSTAREKEEEIIEVMKERNADILELWETRLIEKGAGIIHDNHRMIYSGLNNGRYGVGFNLTSKIQS